MITEYYKINWIDLSDQSLSGKLSEAKLVYCYRVDNETDSKQLMDYIDGNIFESVQKEYPRALLHSENFYDNSQVATSWRWLTSRPSFDLWMIPDVKDEDIENAGFRKCYYDEKYPAMPAVRVKVYMEKSGSDTDAFSPFNRMIALRYPLKLIPQEMNFVQTLHDFVKKALVTLEDICIVKQR